MTKRDSQFVVRRSATGLGPFTLGDIPPGKRIIEYVGPVVTAEEVERRCGRYFFEIDERYSVDGSAREHGPLRQPLLPPQRRGVRHGEEDLDLVEGDYQGR